MAIVNQVMPKKGTVRTAKALRYTANGQLVRQ